MNKKLDEAERIANLRELERREEMERQLRDEQNTNSYRDWMRLQSAKKRQAKSYNKRKRQVDEDLHARNRAQRDMERDMYDGGMDEEDMHMQAQMDD